MAKKTSVKRALIVNALCMLLCVLMLAGTTYAWFTDTASVTANKIQAGTLDVDIIDRDGESVDGETLEFIKIDPTTSEVIDGKVVLWEPGVTYQLPPVRIKNNGNLAIKYKLTISGVTGDNKLLEVLEFTYTMDGAPYDFDTVGHLAADDTSDEIIIAAHMKNDAGNEYQNLSLEGIKLTVDATQDTVEYDSYDNEYDADAQIPVFVANVNALKAAVASNAPAIVFQNDVTENVSDDAAERIVIRQDTTIDFSTNTVDLDYGASLSNWFGFRVGAGTTTVNGSGEGGLVVSGTDGAYPFHVSALPGEEATLIINGGTYYGEPTAVNVQKGTAYINGGFFSCSVADYVADDQYRYLLNCIDANYKNGTASIVVKGGTFVNFNPANNQSEGPNTNYVPAGYTVTQETQTNGDIWYTVVPE